MRRALAEACLERPHSAGELVERAGLAPASVSEHLKVLRKAGVLLLEKRGRFWIYRTDANAIRSAAAALERIAKGERD